tara:strand:+ start:1726 stop:2076 length:351 start_codon:yes stop_codon:yes gene_type:complete
MAGDLIAPTHDGKARLVYILYLAGVVVPLTPVIGVVMAYLDRGEAQPWVASHHTFQIRTFWLSWLFVFIAFVLSFVAIGMLLFPVILVWYIIRCVKGLDAASQGKAISEPGSWLFG